MRLQHLSLGARFEYEGQVFVKTGPLTAASEQGGQRIIPRHAMLRPLEVPVAEGSRAAASDADRVLIAFDTFFATCHRLVDEPHRDELVKAREQFLAALR
jgi:hypothetical protein